MNRNPRGAPCVIIKNSGNSAYKAIEIEANPEIRIAEFSQPIERDVGHYSPHISHKAQDCSVHIVNLNIGLMAPNCGRTGGRTVEFPVGFCFQISLVFSLVRDVSSCQWYPLYF